MRYIIFLSAVIFSVLCSAQQSSVPQTEPSFCDPDTFKTHEVTSPVDNLLKAHIYQFNHFDLAGLAVENSPTELVESLAQHYANYSADEKFCTWYFNDGNDQAAQVFQQKYLSNPIFGDANALVEEYSSVLDDSFDRAAVNFITCARDHGYLAMGCDGMKHRGPSVFAMFLSFAGCTPEHSVALVESVWGKNFVAQAKRLALAQKAYEMGQARPESRRELQSLF